MPTKVQYEYFAEEFIELQRELKNHPEAQAYLASRLEQQDANDIYMKLNILAAYVGIAIDGTYSGEDMRLLASLITDSLKKKGTIIISSSISPYRN